MIIFDITVTVEANSASEALGKLIYDANGEPVTDFKAIQITPQFRVVPAKGSGSGWASGGAPAGGIISGGGSSIVGRV